MSLENYNLKELIKVARINNLADEAKEVIGLKDVKYAKKKQIYDYLKTKDNLNLNLKNEENKKDEPDLASNYDEFNENEVEIPPVPIDEPLVLDLSDLKNNKKLRQKKTIQPVVVETPEEKKERETAVVMLNSYYTRFPWLNNEIIDTIDPITKLKIVKAKLSARNMSNLFAEHFFSVCYGAECAINTTPYVSDYVKLQGFTQNLRAYESTRDLLDELLIEYAPQVGESVAMPVEARLGMVMLAVGVQTHLNNTSGNQNLQNIPQQPTQIKQNLNKPIDNNNFNDNNL